MKKSFTYFLLLISFACTFKNTKEQSIELTQQALASTDDSLRSQMLKKAIQLDGYNLTAAQGLVDLYEEQQDLKKAIAVCNKVIDQAFDQEAVDWAKNKAVSISKRKIEEIKTLPGTDVDELYFYLRYSNLMIDSDDVAMRGLALFELLDFYGPGQIEELIRSELQKLDPGEPADRTTSGFDLVRSSVTIAEYEKKSDVAGGYISLLGQVSATYEMAGRTFPYKEQLKKYYYFQVVLKKLKAKQEMSSD
jgi:hypothetical protein